MTAATVTITRTKAALIRRDGYPIGQPAPLYIRCCGNEIDAKDDGMICPRCQTTFDARGWVTTP